eukprot:5052703-Amphidinium_carterae.1
MCPLSCVFVSLELGWPQSTQSFGMYFRSCRTAPKTGSGPFPRSTCPTIMRENLWFTCACVTILQTALFGRCGSMLNAKPWTRWPTMPRCSSRLS